MKFKKSLAFKLALFILIGTSAVFLGAFGYNYCFSRATTLAHIKSDMNWMARDSVSRINTSLESVAMMPEYAALRLERGPIKESELTDMLEDLVKSHPMVYGSTASFEPYRFSKNKRVFSPYVYEKGKDFIRTDLNSPSYNYFKWHWYTRPQAEGGPVWSEPYFDEGGGNIPMCTYSVPFYFRDAGAKKFAGVVTADISLDWLVELVSSIKVSRTGYAFLVSSKGLLIAHPQKDMVMKGTLSGFAKRIHNQDLMDVADKIAAGQEGFVRASIDDDYWHILFVPMQKSGWSLGIMAPESELFADINALWRKVLIIGASGFGLLFVLAALLSSSFVRPIRLLAGSTAEIARGNLDAKLPPIQSQDELGELSHSFENMRVALKEYIADLARTTAAKERIESELKIARAIQMNFLPKKFPAIAEGKSFELDARLEPAKMVGGDFYDFFMLDEDRLFFSIGDVSDKGVPAALFMAVTKTLMKGIAVPGVGPCEVFKRVNYELAVDNDMMMFVTAFCAVLNLKTGELEYSNAGHLPPLLVRADASTEVLALPPGPVLGIRETAAYSCRTVHMRPGDQLILYTDGITESSSPVGEFYGDERLLALAGATRGAGPEQAIAALFKATGDFSSGAEQFDDMTALAVRYNGSREGRHG